MYSEALLPHAEYFKRAQLLHGCIWHARAFVTDTALLTGFPGLGLCSGGQAGWCPVPREASGGQENPTWPATALCRLWHMAEWMAQPARDLRTVLMYQYPLDLQNGGFCFVITNSAWWIRCISKPAKRKPCKDCSGIWLLIRKLPQEGDSLWPMDWSALKCTTNIFHKQESFSPM